MAKQQEPWTTTLLSTSYAPSPDNVLQQQHASLTTMAQGNCMMEIGKAGQLYLPSQTAVPNALSCIGQPLPLEMSQSQDQLAFHVLTVSSLFPSASLNVIAATTGYSQIDLQLHSSPILQNQNVNTGQVMPGNDQQQPFTSLSNVLQQPVVPFLSPSFFVMITALQLQHSSKHK